MMKGRILSICVLILGVTLAVGCKERAPESLEGVVTFSAGEAMLNDGAARTGDAVKPGDRLVTRAKAALVVQFGAMGVMAIRENSEVVINVSMTAKGSHEIRLLQKLGNTFHRISKGKGEYQVKTPTAIAAVRGTSFGIEIAPDGATGVKLLTGSVAVRSAAPDKDAQEMPESLLESGQKLTATGTGISEPAPLTANDKQQLETLDKIEIIPIEQLPEFRREKKDVVEPSASRILTGSMEAADSAPARVTLDDIRRRFGPLSKVRLNSGREYVGAFKQVGSTMEIITVGGKVRVPSTQVQGVVPY